MTTTDKSKKNIMVHVKLGLAVVLAALLVVFTVQNVEVVQVKFLAWTIEMSRSLLIFSILLTGILLGWIGAGWLYVRRAVRR